MILPFASNKRMSLVVKVVKAEEFEFTAYDKGGGKKKNTARF